MAAGSESCFAFVTDVDFGYGGFVPLVLDIFIVLFDEFGDFGLASGGSVSVLGNDLSFMGVFWFTFFDAEADVDASF